MRICAIFLGCFLFLVLNPYWDAHSEPITQPQKEVSHYSKKEQLGSRVLKYTQTIINHFLSASGGPADRAADNLPTILPVLSQTQWLKYLEGMTASAATKFDKALDARYLQTNLGGSIHRLLDGGHTIWGAWSNIARMCAETGCSRREQIDGYFKALLKDATTPKGLPFMTMEKQTYDSIAGRLNKYGISRNWTYDALSYDALEVFTTGISAGAVVYFLKTEQPEELSEVLGAMGVVSILSANPALALATTSSVLYALTAGTDLNAWATVEGIVKTSLISGALVLLPGAFLVQAPVAVAVSILLEKGMTEGNYLLAKEYVLEKISALTTLGFGIGEQVVDTGVEKVKTWGLYNKGLSAFSEMIPFGS